mmetsp:Transcript_2676/g.6446  ORF Transcript_2676/g.6446 Transcript_2676/m.6446 type:complete len:210 (+) Transcript_2676:69-698(+)
MHVLLPRHLSPHFHFRLPPPLRPTTAEQRGGAHGVRLKPAAARLVVEAADARRPHAVSPEPILSTKLGKRPPLVLTHVSVVVLSSCRLCWPLSKSQRPALSHRSRRENQRRRRRLAALLSLRGLERWSPPQHLPWPTPPLPLEGRTSMRSSTRAHPPIPKTHWRVWFSGSRAVSGRSIIARMVPPIVPICALSSSIWALPKMPSWYSTS